MDPEQADVFAPTEVDPDGPTFRGGPEGPGRSGTPERRHFGRFQALSRVGAGGMGEVYVAWDPRLDRRVGERRRSSSHARSVGPSTNSMTMKSYAPWIPDESDLHFLERLAREYEGYAGEARASPRAGFLLRDATRSTVVLPRIDFKEVTDECARLRPETDRCKAMSGMTGSIKLRLYFQGSTGKLVKYDLLTGPADAGACIFEVLRKKARVTRFQSAQEAANRIF